jgi:hypothetical protein
MIRKEILTILAVVMFFGVCPVRAVVWTEGYHQINTGEVYGEVGIYNDVRLDIFGGEMSYLFAFDTTLTNWYDGQMSYLRANDNSVVNIFGGRLLDFLYAGESSQINLYAYEVTYNDITHFIEGKYYKDNLHFSFELLHGQDTYSHIVVVPEPSTLLFLWLGGIFIRKRK